MMERPVKLACASCPAHPCAVCRPLPPPARTELMAAIEAYHHPPSAEIPLARGSVNILADGLVLVERSLDDKRRQVVAFRFPGDMLCFDGEPETTSRLRTVAVTAVTVCRLPSELITDLGRRHAEFLEAMMEGACREISWLGERLLTLGRMSAQERIAIFLLEMLSRSGQPLGPGGEVSVHLPMNREDIADYLGLNVETVSRTLSRFKRMGLIRLPKPGRAVIADDAPLRAQAPLRVAGPVGQA